MYTIFIMILYDTFTFVILQNATLLSLLDL